MKTKKAGSFPDTIYVQWFREGKEKYPVASTSPEDVMDQDLAGNEAGRDVGVYKLVKRVSMTESRQIIMTDL